MARQRTGKGCIEGFWRRCVIGFAASLPLAVSADAQVSVVLWDDTAESAQFAAASSWVGGTAPDADDIAEFSASSGVKNPILESTISLGGIRFSAGAASYLVGGAAGVFQNLRQIDQLATNEQEITSQLLLGASDHELRATIQSTGNLILSGSVSVANSATMLLSGAGSSTTGSWLLRGDIDMQASLALVSGETSTDFGSILVTGDIALGAHALSLEGLGGYRTSLSATANGQGGVISGGISGNGTIVKKDDGNWTLSGNNTDFTGTINVLNGRLVAQGVQALGTSSTVFLERDEADQRNAPNDGTAVEADLELELVAPTAAQMDFGPLIVDAVTNSAIRISNGGGSTAANVRIGTLRLGEATVDLRRGSNDTGTAVLTLGQVVLTSASDTNLPTLNPGANVLTVIQGDIVDAESSVGGNFRHIGAGVVLLQGNGMHTGYTLMQGAVLALGDASSLAANENIYVTNGGVIGMAGNRSISFGVGQGQYNLGGTPGPSNNNAGFIGYGNDLYLDMGGDGVVWGLTPGFFTEQAGSLVLGSTFATHDISITNDFSLGEADRTIIVLGSKTASLLGTVAGDGGLIKSGSGRLVLSEATYLGSTTVTSGTLTLASDSALPSGSSLMLESATVLELSGHSAIIGGLSGAGVIRLGDGGELTVSAGSYSGVISDNGSLVKTGSGTLTLGGVNTYSGGTKIEGGTIAYAANNALPNGGVVTMSASTAGATLDLAGFSDTIGGLTFGGTGTSSGATHAVLTGSGTLTLAGSVSYLSVGHPGVASISGNMALGTSNLVSDARQFDVSDSSATSTELAVSAVLSGSAGLLKSGSGTMLLSGNNTYTGATTVVAGVLRVNGSIESSSLSLIAAAGTLAGAGSVGTLMVEGTLAPGNSPGELSAGDTTLAAGAIYEWEINNAQGVAGTNWDLLTVNGVLSLAGTTEAPISLELISLTAADLPGGVINFDSSRDYSYTIATATGGILGFDAGHFTINTSGFVNAFAGLWSVSSDGSELTLNYTANPAAIPEPSVWALSVGGLAVFWALARRYRHRRRYETSAAVSG